MLRAGFISYLNAYPFYYPFQFLKGEELTGLELTIERPGKLNSMLRNGELDISLISFMEYAKYPHLYELIQGIGLSSKGYVDSVKLFSKVPIKDLNGHNIHTTNASATSVAIMEILLKENDVHDYICAPYEATEGIPDKTAALAIGDEALTENTKHFSYVYDLGEMWNKLFSRNIVFATAAIRKDSIEYKLPQINSFVNELKNAPKKSFADNGSFEEACKKQFPDIKDPMAYLNRLHFGMSQSEEKDIEFFLSKAFEHALLTKLVKPEFFIQALELAGNGELNA
ncbi:MAG: menaquinone biosynthesis protein [Lentisphaeraceae bacterium]|nr:menaquinone biosynthesis protein [Lentisphaeraceae bacterium]